MIAMGIVLTVVLTYPVAFQIDRVARVNTDDGRWSIWVVAWVAEALTSNPLRLFDANIFYPHRSTLAFSEANIGAGLIAAPAWALTRNPYTAQNVAFLASFVLAFAGAYFLARHLTGSRAASAVAAILFAFCPYVFARTAHIQLLYTGMMPLCLLAFHRLVEARSVGRAVTLGVALWATALTCGYYAVFVALMVGLGTIVFALSRDLWRSKDYWIAIAIAAYTAIGLSLPFLIPYWSLQQDFGFARTLNDARAYSANGLAWLTSSAWAHRWWLPLVNGYNEVLFPGILTTSLGLAGATMAWFVRGRSAYPRDVILLYALIGGLAFWASFGPDAGLYRVIFAAMPFASFLRAPARMAIMTTLALTMLTAIFTSVMIARQRRPRLEWAVLVVIALTDVATMPLRQYRPTTTFDPAYRVLATLPRGAVAEFPYWYQRPSFPRHAEYMLNSTVHWQPLVNGYSDHIPADFRETAHQLSEFPSPESFGILEQRGARYVTFHLNLIDVPTREILMRRLFDYRAYLRPLVRDGNVWLYEIMAWPR